MITAPNKINPQTPKCRPMHTWKWNTAKMGRAHHLLQSFNVHESLCNRLPYIYLTYSFLPQTQLVISSARRI